MLFTFRISVQFIFVLLAAGPVRAQRLEEDPQTFHCGIEQDTHILLAWQDPRLFVYQHGSDHGVVYYIGLKDARIDSARVPLEDEMLANAYAPTAFAVHGDSAVLCIGNHIQHYRIRSERWEPTHQTKLGDQQVAFHAGLDSMGIQLAIQRPDIGSHHIFEYRAYRQALRSFLHPHSFAFLCTFAPNHYFDQHGDSLFFLDNSSFSIWSWSDSMRTILDLSVHFDTSAYSLRSSVANRSFREKRALFMDQFDQHRFDLITDLYVADSSIHLLYFPTIETGTRLKRSYFFYDRTRRIGRHVSLVESSPPGLLGFKCIAIDDLLYWVRAENGKILVGTFPTS